MRKNNKQINFRVSEKDYNYIKRQSEKANIDGLDDATRELAKIGNNLNQLTRLCHQGVITCLDLSEIREQVKHIWQLLNLLTPNQL